MTKRIGNQSPTQSVLLPFRESRFQEAVDLYQRSGRTVHDWQSGLLEPILATNDEGLWVHTKFGYSVPRRNGKNEVVAMRELFGLYLGQNMLHTAHRTTTSHAAWERLCNILDESSVDYKSLRATGRERIELDETGGRIEFRTRTTTGGLGEDLTYSSLMKRRVHRRPESALKYTVTDSKNPQTIKCVERRRPRSEWDGLPALRTKAIEGGAVNTGWAEWSVEKESDPYDRELWYKTNPSLGLIFTERSVSDEIGSDIIDFNIQRLGLWLKYNQKSAISENEWMDLKAKTLPVLKGRLFAGIKYSHDGQSVALSIAVKTATGKIFLEAIDCQSVRNGNGWILNFLAKADVQKVVVDGASGQQILADEMNDIRLAAPIKPTVSNIIVANASFEKGIFQQTIEHAGQPSLTQIISNCEKRNIGSNGGFGYKSQVEDYDIALMDSAILAHWACSEAKPKRRQRIRY